MVERQSGEIVMIQNMYRLLLAFVLLSCFGCGGGSSDAPVGPTKATISFSLISTATLPFRISGLQIDGILPAGVSVTTGDANYPKLITDGLVPGSAVGNAASWQSPNFGSYSSPKVSIKIADGTNIGFGPGEMARLTCTIATGTTLSENDRLALENAITFKVSGWSPNSTSLTAELKSLNAFLKPKIAITYSN